VAHLGISSFEPNRHDTHSIMKDTHGVEITPELIAQLLDTGQVEIETDDGTRIFLQYDTVPRDRSAGWDE